jgi:CRISPR/Cas system-associated endonuclease/helicase Cas3
VLRPQKRKGEIQSNPSFYYIKEELSQKIHSFHAKTELFTINDLHKHAKDECEYNCSRSKLYKLIKSMGYTFKKSNSRKVLIEQPHLLSKRIRFLRKYQQYLETNKYIFIFLDETWIYQNGSQLRLWVNENDSLGVPKVCKSEGKRKGSPFCMLELLQGSCQIVICFLVQK